MLKRHLGLRYPNHWLGCVREKSPAFKPVRESQVNHEVPVANSIVDFLLRVVGDQHEIYGSYFLYLQSLQLWRLEHENDIQMTIQ